MPQTSLKARASLQLPPIRLIGNDIYQACAATREYEENAFLQEIYYYFKNWLKQPSAEKGWVGRAWNDIRSILTESGKADTKHYLVKASSALEGINILTAKMPAVTALQTVSKDKLTYVARNVSDPRRYFALIEKETTFLPIWLKGQQQPTKPSSDMYLGNLLYTPSGDWYIQLLCKKVMAAYGLKNFKAGDEQEFKSPTIDNMGTPASKIGENMLNVNKRSRFDPKNRHLDKRLDVGFEYLKDNGVNLPIVQVSNAQYIREIGKLFESWRSLRNRGVVPIHEMRVLAPDQHPDSGIRDEDLLPKTKYTTLRS